MSRNLENISKAASGDLSAGKTVAKAVKQIHLEGVLPTRPEYAESDQALRSLDRVLLWSVCARTAAPPLAAKCQAIARAGVAKWIGKYAQPDGNPINESRLLALVKSIDLLIPVMPDTERRAATGWLRKLIAAGDNFNRAQAGKEKSTNNFETWRLAIRALAARTLADKTVLASAASLLTAHVRENIQADGSTWDYHHRDALHYHVYDLQAYVEIAVFAPEVLGDRGLGEVLHALEFLRPFFAGERKHVEFVHSKVQFDRDRRNAGMAHFQNENWDPKQARSLLRLARCRFPQIRPWSGAVVDQEYEPVIKLVAALNGDL
ncbi:MAG: alginate lyase family protein [Deltaproteobacteria bacterium]|nr:alginate lyase family protein [Deltaproteobacteria bacterium]